MSQVRLDYAIKMIGTHAIRFYRPAAYNKGDNRNIKILQPFVVKLMVLVNCAKVEASMTSQRRQGDKAHSLVVL